MRGSRCERMRAIAPNMVSPSEMRVLFWYCDRMSWSPTIKTLDDVEDGAPGEATEAVAAWVHAEPRDVNRRSKVVTKLVKNCKWLAGKWKTKTVILHSFSHLAEERCEPETALEMIENAKQRLENEGYSVVITPWGHFNDLEVSAPGHPLARVYKQF